MLTQPTADLFYESARRHVVVLSWPAQTGLREGLDRKGLPRLWLVEAGVAPPVVDSCLEDWLRLPADESDARARLDSLARRAVHHPMQPTLDAHGQLVHAGALVLLSPVDKQLAARLIADFGEAVADDDLIAAAWREGGTEQTLRVHLSRLRRRLAPIGLAITSIRGYGYAMHAAA
jgi:DNA-binding response OmpR family regulator